MPKAKTRKSVAKRFRLTKKGKIKRARAGRSHILTKKTRAHKRGLRSPGFVDIVDKKTIRRLLPYG